MIGSGEIAVLVGAFVASSVEVTEMVIIVVGVGATRGWRSTWIGAGSGLVVLVGIIAALGRALQLIPIDTVRIVIGALLLTFGLQWFRQGVIQTAASGFTGGAEEEDAGGGGRTGGAFDWTAFVLAFKGVLLEGLEVAFIVVAFGYGSGTGSSGSNAAYLGAAAAFVVIGAVGLIAKQRLERVPGRTLKFGVGGLLSTFGTFWALEGLGVHWPGGDLSLLWLYALYLGSTILLMIAVRRGLLGPAPPSALHDPGPAGPSGLAPASEDSVRAFQEEHGLAADGVVGARTQAAVRAVRAERSATLDVLRVGVDAADADAIAALQRRLDLPVSGEIDAVTRGAVRLLQHPGFVDVVDEAAVRRFQRDHGLEATGALDDATRVSLAAVLADGDGPQRRGVQRGDGPDPVAAYRALDPADKRSVCRFQQSVGIAESGDVDDETRGAMRALRAWLAVDPTDADVVRSVQRRHGLVEDGIVGARTRAAIERERDRASGARISPPTSEPDPADADAVASFQRRRGLVDDGVIGPRTRAAIRWEREHHLSVDAADAGSIRAFQRTHGLTPDGVLGERTRAALQAARREREPSSDEGQREQRYGTAGHPNDGRVVDPADEDAVRRFQRGHGLAGDGAIGPHTQAAMRAVRAERNGAADREWEGRQPVRPVRRAGKLIVSFGRFWYDFIIGDDWTAAAGVGVMLLGAWGLTSVGFAAWWFGPLVVLATATFTIGRELQRPAEAC